MANILIIDDNENICSMLAQMLIDGGHVVTTAADGFEGYQRFRANPADLVFVDMMMPYGGLAVIHELHQQYPGVRIIAMSGGPTFRLGIARDLGVGHTLVKPFTPEQLADVVAAELATAPPPPNENDSSRRSRRNRPSPFPTHSWLE